MKLLTNRNCEIYDSKCLKLHCKTVFDDVLKEIEDYRRGNQLSDQDFRFFYSALMAHYVGCLVEAEFETRMAKWTDKLFSHWIQHSGRL